MHRRRFCYKKQPLVCADEGLCGLCMTCLEWLQQICTALIGSSRKDALETFHRNVSKIKK